MVLPHRFVNGLAKPKSHKHSPAFSAEVTTVRQGVKQRAAKLSKGNTELVSCFCALHVPILSHVNGATAFEGDACFNFTIVFAFVSLLEATVAITKLL